MPLTPACEVYLGNMGSGLAGAQKLQFVQMFTPFAGLAGLILAVVALIRRERFWFLALLTLLLGLAMVGLFCFLGGGIDEKG
jgi:hypothetical protein